MRDSTAVSSHPIAGGNRVTLYGSRSVTLEMCQSYNLICLGLTCDFLRAKSRCRRGVLRFYLRCFSPDAKKMFTSINELFFFFSIFRYVVAKLNESCPLFRRKYRHKQVYQTREDVLTDYREYYKPRFQNSQNLICKELALSQNS